MIVFDFLESLKFISRKIWVAKKSWNHLLSFNFTNFFQFFQKCVEKTQKMTKPPTAKKGGTLKKAAQRPVKGTIVTKGAQVPAEVDLAAAETEIDPTTLHPVSEDVHVAIIPTIPTRKNGSENIEIHHHVDPLAVSVSSKPSLTSSPIWISRQIRTDGKNIWISRQKRVKTRRKTYEN